MSNENTTAIREMNLFEKMEAITAELQTVAKNLDVSTGGRNSYKAVSERDIIDAVKPLEAKYRVYSYPCDREIIESSILESEDYSGKKKSTFFTRMKTTYMFVNIDNTDEKITTVTFSEGIDSQDKGSGKAMTYADKYALMKSYKISTGDDPDQNASEDNNFKPSNSQTTRNKAVQKCAGCGNVIRDTPRKDGSGVMTADEIAKYSINRFGAAYCVDCQKKKPRNN